MSIGHTDCHAKKVYEVPYNANRSRWKSSADAWVNLNSLENFHGVLIPLNL